MPALVLGFKVLALATGLTALALDVITANAMVHYTVWPKTE